MKILIINICILMICGCCLAQNFKSAELKEIYTLWQKNGSPQGCEIRKDKNGLIEHIGRPLFAKEVRRGINPLIADFLERYNLYLSLVSKSERAAIMRERKIETDGENMFAADSLCSFTLLVDNEKYTAVWSKNGFDVCRVGFDKNYSLISGLNIAESQRYFVNEVVNISFGKPLEYNYLSFADDGTFFVRNSGYYVLRDIRSDMYYSKKDSLPVCDYRYPSQTVANLAAGLIDGGCVLNVTQSMYNYEKEHYSVSMLDFANYCISNGCTAFTGIESIENDTITATIIYRNDDLGYNHLIYLQIPTGVLKQRTGVITARLNTFIPTHNLSNIYNDKL